MSTRRAATAVAIAPDGVLWAAWSDARVARLQHGPEGLRIAEEFESEPAAALVASHEGVIALGPERVSVFPSGVSARHALGGQRRAVAIATTNGSARVFVAGADRAEVFELRPGGLQRVGHVPFASAAELSDFDVSPDGRTIVRIASRTQVEAYSVARGERLGAWSRADRHLRDVFARFTPDGRHVHAALSRCRTIQRVKPATGRGRRSGASELRVHASWIGPLAASPDRRYLAVRVNGDDLQVFDLETGLTHGFLSPDLDVSTAKLFRGFARQPDHEGRVRALAVGPAGRVALLGDGDGAITHVDLQHGGVERLVDRERSEPLARPCGVAQERYPCFDGGHRAGDALTLVGIDGALRGIDLRTLEPAVHGQLEDLRGKHPLPPKLELARHRDRWVGVVRGELRLWDSDGRVVSREPLDGSAAHVGDHVYLLGRRAGDAWPLRRYALTEGAWLEREPIRLDELGGAPVESLRFLGGPRPLMELRAPHGTSSFALFEDRADDRVRRLEGASWPTPSAGARFAVAPLLRGYAIYDLSRGAASIEHVEVDPTVLGEPLCALTYEPGCELVAGYDASCHRICVFERGSPELVAHLVGHGKRVTHLWIARDGSGLVSRDVDSQIRRWRLPARGDG